MHHDLAKRLIKTNIESNMPDYLSRTSLMKGLNQGYICWQKYKNSVVQSVLYDDIIDSYDDKKLFDKWIKILKSKFPSIKFVLEEFQFED